MGKSLDPVTASVVEHGLLSVTDEMATVVVASSGCEWEGI